ncbi:hypothetical protein V6669_20195 [Paenibacillus sp. Y5S-9]|uniref:hypothetical protein n=1 Tax=Paenibacillus sp. Y5S-9 TaxID=3122489 RepID=UPI0030CD59E6
MEIVTEYMTYSTREIYHRKSAEYFVEVHSSFVNKNFRSALVTLYSVVMADLVFKLQESFDIYEDEGAKSILDEIREMQKNKPTSSEWENTLIEAIIKRTKLLDNHEGENLKHLRQHRHLCAHPVLDQADVLFSPNEETVLAHIKNNIDGILSKGALLKGDIFVDMVTSLENDKKYLTSEPVLEKYVVSKYLKHLSPELEKKVFKSLWRVVFKADDYKCVENRDINYKVLRIMLYRNADTLKSLIAEESIYFSQIKDDPVMTSLLANLLFEFSDIFVKLEAHAQELLTVHINAEDSKIIKAFYLKRTVEEHYSYLKKRYHRIDQERYGEKYIVNRVFQISDINVLDEVARETNSFNDFYSLLIMHYSYSHSFDMAAHNFDRCIAPYLDKFNEELMLELIDGFDNNDQVHASIRRYVTHEFKLIKNQADVVLGEEFDYKPYPNFKSYIEE